MLVDKLQASTLFIIERLGQSEEAGMKPSTYSLFSHFWLYSKS